MEKLEKLKIAFAEALERGERFESIVQARQYGAQALGEAIPAGSMLAKGLEESIEGALVRVGRRIVTQSSTSIEAFEGLIDLYQRQPRLGVRTSTSMRQQAYSTPLPIGFLAASLAGLDQTKTVYEPTAGHGALILGSDPSRTYANELNLDRAADLRAQGYITTTADATGHLPPEKVDVVIANPPFGKVQGQSWQVRGGTATRAYRSTQIDHVIAFQALSSMKDDGRAVLILAAPMASKLGDLEKASNAYNGKQTGPFYKSLYDNYRVVEHFTVGGDLYGRQGTTFPVDVVVIEGRGKSSRRLPAVDLPKVYTSFQSLKELLNHERINQPSKQPTNERSSNEPSTNRDTDRSNEEIHPGYDSGGSGGISEPASAGDRFNRDDTERGNSVPTAKEWPGRVSRTSVPVEAAGGVAGLSTDGNLVSEQRGDTEDEIVPRGQQSSGGVHGLSSREGGMDDAARRERSDGTEHHYPLPESGGVVSDRGAVEERDGAGMGGSSDGLQLRVSGMAEGSLYGERAGSELPDGTSSSNTGGQGDDRGNDLRGMDDISRNNLQGVGLMADQQAILDDDILDGEQIKQVLYQAKSGAPNVDTLVPANMRSSIGNALDNLEQEVGNLDDYVAGRLGIQNRETLYSRYSAEQVDALALAFSNLSKGEAFIIGDQTGIGKGRFVAGVLEYARQRELIPIFVTERPDLYTDIFRDIADIKVKEFNPLITNSDVEVLLPDGSSLKTGKVPAQKQLIKDLASRRDIGNYDSVFTTYSQLQTVKGGDTDRRELLRAIAPMSILVLDESHNAGGTAKTYGVKAKEPDRADFVRELVRLSSGVVYSSATYAKNPHVMTLYSARTGMRHAVEREESLVELIQNGGVPLQQMLASKLTEAGQYIRRERSYTGIEFGAKVLPVNREAAENIAKAMSMIMEFDYAKQDAVDGMDDEIKSEAKRVIRDDSIGKAGASSTNFTALMHNVVGQTLLAMKAEATVQESLEALRRGEKPVIGLSNTMGSFIGEAADEQSLRVGDPIDLSVGDLLIRYLERSRVLTLRDYDGRRESYRMTDAELGPEAVAIFEETKDLIREIDWSDIPISPIDYIRYRLTQEGYTANELTKRDDRIEYGADGEQYYEQRNSGEKSVEANTRKIKAFNSGELDVLILNRSGATGISLHASERFTDQRPRRMIIAQPELNIDQFMQMLGRVHRTGQVTKPSFTLLMGDIPAEKRPAAVLLKKLASLNANTTAARESGFNLNTVTDFMNKYGDRVILELLADNPSLNRRLGSPIKGLNEDADLDAIETKDVIAKVTGRIPLLPIAEQDRVYDLIESAYTDLLERERSMGNNILEAEGLDLDARTIAKLEVLPAREGQASLFNEPVYLEVIDAKARRKPMTTLEVVNAVRFELGLEPVQTIAEHDFEQVEELAQEQTSARVSKIEELIPIYRDAYQVRVEEEVLDDSKLKTPAERDKKIQSRMDYYQTRADSNLKWMERDFERLPPGAPVEIVDRKTLSVHYGVIEGYSNRNLEKGNPALPSKWKMNILVADSFRRMSLPMSQVNQNTERGYQIRPTLETWQGKDIYGLFDERQSMSREVRQMFTGNVLRAFEKFQGRLANFTDSNGNIKQGMLMGHDFDLSKQLEREPVVFPSAQKALSYLDEVGNGLNTRDMDLTILPQMKAGEGYTLSVSLGKAGAKYHSDKGLMDAMNREFVSVGSFMKTMVPQERMLGTLEYLMSQEGGGIVADKYKEKARAFLGIEIPSTREILSGASAQVFSADKPVHKELEAPVPEPAAETQQPEPKAEPPAVAEQSIEQGEVLAPEPESQRPAAPAIQQPKQPAQPKEPIKAEVVAPAPTPAPTWEEKRHELVEVSLLPARFVDAMHDLGLVSAEGFGDRAHAQLNLPGVDKASPQVREESDRRSFWFQIGRGQISRVLVADNPMDALSLSTVDRRQGGTVYMGGSVEALPKEMLRQFAQQGGEIYVAYGDSAAGEQKAWGLAKDIPQVQRRRPIQESWSNQVQNITTNTETKEWLRIAKALEHTPKYQSQILQISTQAPDAKAALQRDTQEFRKLQDKLWNWHYAARETNANSRYLGAIADIGIGLNGAEPRPLSEKAKTTMHEVIKFHASRKVQAQSQNTGLDLEAG
ncbi:MAG: strawberry notch C-terminal domain-containing protein [Thermosynechococcaceae cyanobacterium MS004]|nr:strawberry notch C-terminal domain-containing protein [Thermosynechococcaceae cyanobacterium MS004]